MLAEAGLDPEDVTEVVHGTTVASNTILQKTGARTGLLTTRGFRDVLEIGRIRTPGMFDLAWRKPEPLVPRRWRREALERMGADARSLRRWMKHQSSRPQLSSWTSKERCRGMFHQLLRERCTRAAGGGNFSRVRKFIARHRLVRGVAGNQRI